MEQSPNTTAPASGLSDSNAGLVSRMEIPKDPRFVCIKCGSGDTKLSPMWGSVSRCCNCGHRWANP